MKYMYILSYNYSEYEICHKSSWIGRCPSKNFCNISARETQRSDSALEFLVVTAQQAVFLFWLPIAKFGNWQNGLATGKFLLATGNFQSFKTIGFRFFNVAQNAPFRVNLFKIFLGEDPRTPIPMVGECPFQHPPPRILSVLWQLKIAGCQISHNFSATAKKDDRNTDIDNC